MLKSYFPTLERNDIINDIYEKRAQDNTVSKARGT
jgi:hypothetical protein